MNNARKILLLLVYGGYGLFASLLILAYGVSLHPVTTGFSNGILVFTSYVAAFAIAWAPLVLPAKPVVSSDKIPLLIMQVSLILNASVWIYLAPNSHLDGFGLWRIPLSITAVGLNLG